MNKEENFVEIEGKEGKFKEDPDNPGEALLDENDEPISFVEGEPPKTPPEKPEEKPKEPEKAGESKELKSALAQKEHFREKFEQAQIELEKLSKKPSIELPEAQNPMEVVRLAKALEGYNEDEIEFITKNASEKSIDGIIKAAKDEWVTAAIQAMREKVKKNESIPEPSTKQSSSEKPFDKITEEDVAKMSLKEKEEYYIKKGVIKKRPTREG